MCGKFSGNALLSDARALATVAQRASLGTVAEVWNFFAQGNGQIDLRLTLFRMGSLSRTLYTNSGKF
jgi:hypothetical protein